MGYYQGDWYGGTRGDPFWGSLMSLGSKIVSTIKGGAISKIVGHTMPGGGGMPRILGPGMAGIVQRGRGMILKHPVLSGAGAAGAIAAGGVLAGRASRGGGAAVRIPGMHRRKRMNVCNPRALRRAIRRTHGFAKLAMKTIHLVHPKKKARFGGFKKKRKR